MVSRLEVCADAITKFSGYANPESDCYKVRNPGALKAFKVTQPSLPNKLRIFKSHLAGYEALIYDLEIKAKGGSTLSGLTADSPIQELFYSLGFKEEAVNSLLKFMRRALDDSSITPTTSIGWLLQEF